VNSGSASASEIVSGALQDLDRAVIIGQRTYGKGLVQSTRPLSYNTQLKVTTAKYYIPSGRCIQALDYTHRNEDGSVGKIPDSLTHEFKTRAGRKVKDGGGILPDVTTGSQKFSPIASSLLSQFLVFDFATYYHTLHDSVDAPADFRLEETDWIDFLHYLSNKQLDYTTKSELSLDELRKNAEDEAYYASIDQEFMALKKKLTEKKQQDLEKNRKEVLELIEEEIASRYYFQSGRTSVSLLHDREVQSALNLLSDPVRYNTILMHPMPGK
jgi:carboxyl-terminal processing protease